MPFWSKGRSKTSAASTLSPDELLHLAKRYVIQETVGPLKRIARVLGLGLAGAFAFGVGTVIVLIGVLRVLQTETGNFFSGDWSFAPYLLAAIAGVGLIALVIVVLVSVLRVPKSEAEREAVAS
jgi:hypothetical protein